MSQLTFDFGTAIPFGTAALDTFNGGRQVELPAQILRQLELGADLCISISAGKDSQALATVLVALHRARGWKGRIYAVHADLGRIEWAETAGHARRIADELGIEFVVTRRFLRTKSKGRADWDLISRWNQNRVNRLARGKTGLPWSGAEKKARFCTSELKTQPINQEINYRGAQRTVCALGIRRAESGGRANTPAWEQRDNNNSRRVSLTWNPLIHWTEADVWTAMGTSQAELDSRRGLYADGQTELALAGWVGHPAYVYGNDRLSCVFCIMGSQNDLAVGATHNPELAAQLIAMEDESGYTFQPKVSLRAAVARAAARAA